MYLRPVPESHVDRRPRRWLRALLLVLLVVAPAVGLGLTYCYAFVRSEAVNAYVMIPDDASDYPLQSTKMSEGDHARLIEHHLVLLKSPMVVELALRDQAVYDLDIVREQGEGVHEWLESRLHAERVGGNVVQVTLWAPPHQSHQAVILLNAVLRSFLDQVSLVYSLRLSAYQQDLAAAVQQLEKQVKDGMVELEQKPGAKSPEQRARQAVLATKLASQRRLLSQLSRRLGLAEVALSLAQGDETPRGQPEVIAWASEKPLKP